MKGKRFELFKLISGIYILFLMTIVLFSSCSKDTDDIQVDKDDKEEINLFFSLSKTELIGTSSKTEFSLNIKTNSDWNVVSKPDWIEMNQESGDQDIQITITFLEHTSSEHRSGEVKFKSIGKTHILNIYQNSIPLELVSFSGSLEAVKMKENKFLLFNKPVKLNYINSGEDRYSFFAGPDDVEYFDNNKGINFTVGPSYLGDGYMYKYSVTDNENNTLTGTVEINFYSKKIIIPGLIKKILLDDDNNLWVLSSQQNSYLLKLKQNKDSYEEELRFDIGVDGAYDFCINPYNDFIYIPDSKNRAIKIFTKEGSLVESLVINPKGTGQSYDIRPSRIGFIKSGKGIITIGGKYLSTSVPWLYIDSSNDHLITQLEHSWENSMTGPFTSFVLNQDKSNLYCIEDRTAVIKIFNGQESFEKINIYEIYPERGDATMLTQNKLNNKLYVSGLHNQMIITPDNSFFSKQTYQQSLLADFCYETNKENYIYALSDDYLHLYDYGNTITICEFHTSHYFNWTHGRDLITTVDDKFIITYTDYVDNYTTRSQLIFFETEMFK